MSKARFWRSSATRTSVFIFSITWCGLNSYVSCVNILKDNVVTDHSFVCSYTVCYTVSKASVVPKKDSRSLWAAVAWKLNEQQTSVRFKLLIRRNNINNNNNNKIIICNYLWFKETPVCNTKHWFGRDWLYYCFINSLLQSRICR